MNILQPTIVTIGRRRYRKNPINFQFSGNYEEEEIENVSSKIKDFAIYDDDNDENNYNDEACGLDNNEDDNNIRECENGSYSVEMKIPSAYYGHIIGRNGEQKRRLETDTKTTIVIPQKRASENEPLVIKGPTKASVVSCENRLQVIICSARQKQPFTHLLTFPLTFEGLKKTFNEFKTEVLKACSKDRGVDESIFQNPNKIHLTIGTLVLLDTKEKNDAISLLNECNRTFIKELIDDKPLKIRLQGLEYMNDDPGSVDVLYAKVKMEDERERGNFVNKMQMISDRLVEKFCHSGLMLRQYEKVKLHATVINSLRRKEDEKPTSESSSSKEQERKPFDARNILKRFGNYDFGTYLINELHISIRYSAGTNGYYDHLAKINF